MQPRLEHLIGHTVEDVNRSGIIFESGWRIKKSQQWDKSLVGQRFTMVKQAGDDVHLVFNQGEAIAPKSEITIYNPDDDTSYDPFAVVDISADFPPDPSPERIATAPTDKEVRREIVSKEEVEDAE